MQGVQTRYITRWPLAVSGSLPTKIDRSNIPAQICLHKHACTMVVADGTKCRF